MITAVLGALMLIRCLIYGELREFIFSEVVREYHNATIKMMSRCVGKDIVILKMNHCIYGLQCSITVRSQHIVNANSSCGLGLASSRGQNNLLMNYAGFIERGASSHSLFIYRNWNLICSEFYAPPRNEIFRVCAAYIHLTRVDFPCDNFRLIDGKIPRSKYRDDLKGIVSDISAQRVDLPLSCDGLLRRGFGEFCGGVNKLVVLSTTGSHFSQLALDSEESEPRYYRAGYANKAKNDGEPSNRSGRPSQRSLIYLMFSIILIESAGLAAGSLYLKFIFGAAGREKERLESELFSPARPPSPPLIAKPATAHPGHEKRDFEVSDVSGGAVLV
jgi:hypothetical protein